MTEAEKTKARRAQNLIYLIMGLFIAVPAVIYLFFR